MKRILFAILALGAVEAVTAKRYEDNDEVATCKSRCHRRDKQCHTECERSVPHNFAHGVNNVVRGGVQTGSAGLLPVTQEGMDDARAGEYNPVRNIGTGVRDTAKGVVQTGSLGLIGRGWTDNAE